jgi:hypothetical protein
MDPNCDGYADLAVQIEDSDGFFEIAGTTATLTSNLLRELGGTPVKGFDSICIVA